MKTLTLMLGLAFLGAACSGTGYKNAQDEETINADFGSTDKQRFVEGVVRLRKPVAATVVHMTVTVVLGCI